MTCRALRRILCAVICLVSPAPPLWAQSVGGELTGRVTDSDGRVVQDILIVVEEARCVEAADKPPSGCRQWKAWSGYQGTFFVAYLRAGRYRATVRLGPFSPYEQAIEIQSGVNGFLDIVLVLHAKEEVQVGTPAVASAPDPGVSNTSPLSSRSFSRSDIDAAMPNGRTLQTFWALVPGLVVTESTGSLAQFTAGGQGRFTNRLRIDGVSADLAVDVAHPGIGEAASGGMPALSTTGGTQTLVPLDAIDEIQVRTTAVTSEYARTPGAQTSIVTRSGGDRLALRLFGETRPARFSASDWFSNAGQAPPRDQYFDSMGASIGGPVVSRSLRYFATWQRQTIERAVTTTIQVPSLSARATAPAHLKPLLEAFPVPNGAEVGSNLANYSGRFPIESALSTVSTRVDADTPRKGRFFARLGYGVSSGDALPLARQFPYLSYSNRESTSTTTATAGWSAVMGDSTTNDIRVNVTTHRGSTQNGAARHGDTRPLPVADLVPADPESAALFVTLFPGSYGSVATGITGASRQLQLQLSDTLSRTKGRAQWRLGLEYTRVVTETGPAPNRYQYRFGSIDNLLRDGSVLVSAVRLEAAEVVRESWAAFAQGTFRPWPRLSLDYGARFSVAPAPIDRSGRQPLLFQFEALPELRRLPYGSRLWNTAWNSVAPRLGATYSLGATERSTTLRAAWGLSFDDLTSPGATPFGRGYPYLTGRQLAISHFPLVAADIPADLPEPFAIGSGSEYFSFPTQLRRPYVHEWEFGVDQILPGGQRLGMAYVGAAGYDLVYWYAYPVAGTTRPSVNAYSNDGRSSYHGLMTEYVKRMAHGWQARVTHTWGHAIDLDSGERSAPNPPPTWIPPETNRASADFDRRHVLQLQATYRFQPPRRLPGILQAICTSWQVDAVATVQTGAPTSVTTFRSLENGIYTLGVDVISTTPFWLDDATSPTGRRLNQDAFRVPAEPRPGTLGRNSLRASPLKQVDVAISRVWSIGRSTIQARIDAFNVFNTPNFGPPVGDYHLSSFGKPLQSYAEALGTGTLTSGGLSPLNQAGGPRTIQIGLRIER